MKKRNVFFCISNFKKLTLICLCLVLVFIFLIITPTILSNNKVYTYTVVIDAGHGGIDGGCEGYSGTVESEINLEYAQTLKEYCDSFGFKTIMTRTNESGLYSPFAINKKKDDMKNRKSIIEKAKPDAVISIHMNSYSASSSRGAQCFYNKDNKNSKMLADSIQKQFVQNLVKPRKTTQSGDYYMLNCTQYSSVIVECGFISNQEEEKLLLNKDYKDNVCYSILCGILSYLM